MIKRSFELATASALLSIAMVVVLAGSASASGSTCATTCASAVGFESYGEVFTVHDYASDSRATYGSIQVWKDGAWNTKAQVYNRNGYNGPAESVNLDIVDGRSVRYIACFLKDGVPVDCGNWQHDTA